MKNPLMFLIIVELILIVGLVVFLMFGKQKYDPASGKIGYFGIKTDDPDATPETTTPAATTTA